MREKHYWRLVITVYLPLNSYNLAFSHCETDADDYKSFFMRKIHKFYIIDIFIKAFTKCLQKVLKRIKNNSIVKMDYMTDV
jgi:hypothetical protein